MQLVYFWIEKFKALRNQGINFTSEYQFEMLKKENNYILKRKTNEEIKFPKNFFNKNIENISCIIGENGSGKTSIIQALLFYQYYYTNPFYSKNSLSKNLFIFENAGLLFIYKNFSEIDINFDFKEIFDYEEPSNLQLTSKNFFKKLDFIYFNSNFDAVFPRGINNVKNISKKNKIDDIIVKVDTNEIEIAGQSITSKYYRQTFHNNLEFIINNNLLIENIPFDNFKKKLVSIKNNGVIKCTFYENPTSIINKHGNDKLFIELYNKINIQDSLKSKRNKFLIKIWHSISFSIFYEIVNNKLEEDIVDSLDKRKKEESLESWFKKIFLKLKKISDDYDLKLLNNKLKNKLDNNINFLTKINMFELESLETLSSFILSSKNIKFYDNYFTFKYSKNSELCQSFLNWKKGTDLYYLEFEEKLSSGEFEFLNLLQSLYYASLNLKKDSQIFIILEELEAFMHPEWQRKIIYFISSLGNYIKNFQNRKIQIILASHTPFIIGDLPEKNIIFMKNGIISNNTTKTFGGNIYNILKETFLMESCFGEFSRKKIKKVIDLLDKNKGKYNTEEIEKNIAEIEFIINSIGEPLIKNKLDKMYNDYKEFKNIENSKDNNEEIDFKKYIKENNLNLSEVMKILEERKNDKTI